MNLPCGWTSQGYNPPSQRPFLLEERADTSGDGVDPLLIYLAAPLFSQAERLWNRKLSAAITGILPQARFILPQSFSPDGDDAYASLYQQCVDGVREADVVVAVLDGPDVDSGVAWEMGYAGALGKPVIGVRTDMRESQEQGVNLMLSRSCDALVRAAEFDDDIDAVARRVAESIEAVARANRER